MVATGPVVGGGPATAAEAEAELLIASWMAFGDVASAEEGVALTGAIDELDELETVGLAANFEAGETPEWMMQGLVK